jgi:hypothetical protein
MSHAVTGSIPVHALLTGVQRAFRALVPIAVDLGVRWREPENYLDWDAVASGIFEGFALAAIRSSVGWTDCLPLIDYDRRVVDYGQLSYVAVELQGNQFPLVCIETTADPFDMCLVAELGADLKVKGLLHVPVVECRFAALGRLPSGETSLAYTIAW